MLFSQYFYYRKPVKKLEADGSLPSSPVQRYGTHGRRTSVEYDHSVRYRELSNAAANVAIAAALAASASEEEMLLDQGKEAILKQRPTHQRSSTSITRSEAEEAEDEVDEDALAALADSFHSDSGRKRVSWSQERYVSGRGGSTSRTRSGGHASMSPLTPLYSASSTGIPGNSAGSVNGRGRPLERQVQIVDSPIEVSDLEGGTEAVHRSVSRSLVRARRNSRASQRSARLVFLGVWALFGIGAISQRNRSASSSHGIVLTNTASPSPSYPTAISSLYSSDTPEEPTSMDFLLEQTASSGPEEPSSERIIGRIFAWACTTLYLTSRLPQIWKNVRLVHFSIITKLIYFHLVRSQISRGPLNVPIRICIPRKHVLRSIYSVVSHDVQTSASLHGFSSRKHAVSISAFSFEFWQLTFPEQISPRIRWHALIRRNNCLSILPVPSSSSSSRSSPPSAFTPAFASPLFLFPISHELVQSCT